MGSQFWGWMKCGVRKLGYESEQKKNVSKWDLQLTVLLQLRFSFWATLKSMLHKLKISAWQTQKRAIAIPHIPWLNPIPLCSALFTPPLIVALDLELALSLEFSQSVSVLASVCVCVLRLCAWFDSHETKAK